jgi:hypothetical protein
MRRVAIGVILLIIVGLVATACGSTNDALQNQRRASVKERSATFAKAEAQVPVPKIDNFPKRQTLAESTSREALPNHPWYVYLLGMNGNVVAYYVAKSVPVNNCDFLSSTEAVDSSSYGKVILTAPSLDGIYYGGGGASSACNTLVFFDQATNAEINVSGINTYVTDRPLKVRASAIKVAGSH